jgi:hypothetical protein
MDGDQHALTISFLTFIYIVLGQDCSPKLPGLLAHAGDLQCLPSQSACSAMAQMGKNWVKCFWVNSDFSPDVS